MRELLRELPKHALEGNAEIEIEGLAGALKVQRVGRAPLYRIGDKCSYDAVINGEKVKYDREIIGEEIFEGKDCYVVQISFDPPPSYWD